MMKKLFFIALALSLVTVLPSVAQTGRETGTKWGKGQDSVDAIKNYSLYRGYLNAKNLDDAFALWQKVYESAPRGHKNIIVDGPNMYEQYIAKEQDPAKKQSLYESLIQLYKDRIELYPADEALANNYMAYAVRNYGPKDVEGKKAIVNYLARYFELAVDKADPQDFSVYYSTLVDLYATADATAEDLLNKYDFVLAQVNARVEKGTNAQMWSQLKDYVNQLLLSSGAASCENLVKLFVPQFAAKPDDIALMKNIQSFLIRNDCVETNEEAATLFAKVSEALYAKEPSAQAAAAMARLFIRDGNYEKAMEYLQNALNEETVEENKADYYYQIAYIYANEHNNYVEAKKNINAALAIREWGDPYILLATIYTAGSKSCGENDFEKRQVYWVAVDKLNKAISIDPSVTEKAQSMISQYRRYFPNKEDAFFYGVNEGNAVTVGCWIGERTTARF